MYYVTDKDGQVVSEQFSSKNRAKFEVVQLTMKTGCTSYCIKSTETTRIKVYLDKDNPNSFRIIISDTIIQAKKMANEIAGFKLNFIKGNDYNFIAKLWEKS